MAADIRNRDALRDYTIEDTFEAGIILSGGEVKSIRLGHANWAGGYAAVVKGRVYLHGLHIEPYKFATRPADSVYDPTHPRQLLLNRREIDKLQAATQAEGLTLVPLRLYFKKALIKVELALGRGKKKFDKRAEMKSRVIGRETERLFKYK